MPINHQNGDPDGCALCDSLLLALKTFDPTVVRREAASTCSFRAERNASFAFVYHHKADAHLTIYFRAASGYRSGLPDVVLVRRRSKGSAWAKLFPESLRLSTQTQVESVAAFLFANSYQLAEVGKRSKRGEATKVETSGLEHAREIFQKLWPDRDVRHAFGSLLLNSIRFAHSHGSACWEVTLRNDRVTLNAGPIQVLTLRSHDAGIYFRAPLALPKRLGIRLHPQQPIYAAIPVSSGLCWIPAENVDRLPAQLRDAHMILVSDAAVRRRLSTWRKHHSTGTIDYLEELLGTVVPRPSYVEPEPPPDHRHELSLGGGYGTSASNKEVEQAAIDFVTHYYETQGWLVMSVESERCGFDLLCKRGRQVARVEVKGSSGAALQFPITAGELRLAREDQCFVLAWVKHALSPAPQLEQWSAKVFLDTFEFQTCQYWAKKIKR